MLDSSKQLEQTEVAFKASEYFKELCVGTKIQSFEYSEIQFPIGWKEIIEGLVKSIQRCAIDIILVSDQHAMLEVIFNVRSRPTREVIVWRAIEDARIKSMKTCANCGEIKSHRFSTMKSLLCESCSKNAAKIGKTGTWLDKYN